MISNLPGYPDNIRTSNGGMLWVPLGQVRLEDDSWVTERPWLRDLLAVVCLISILFFPKNLFQFRILIEFYFEFSFLIFPKVGFLTDY